MLQYKMNVLQELKNAGYSTYRIRAEKILSEGTMQRLRTGSTAITVESLGILCNILRCQPGDILEWAAEDCMPAHSTTSRKEPPLWIN